MLINPTIESRMRFPDYANIDSGKNVSAEITSLDAGNQNTLYTATEDCYARINIIQTSDSSGYTIAVCVNGKHVISKNGSYQGVNSNMFALIPLSKGDVVSAYKNSTSITGTVSISPVPLK